MNKIKKSVVLKDFMVLKVMPIHTAVLAYISNNDFRYQVVKKLSASQLVYSKGHLALQAPHAGPSQ